MSKVFTPSAPPISRENTDANIGGGGASGSMTSRNSTINNSGSNNNSNNNNDDKNNNPKISSNKNTSADNNVVELQKAVADVRQLKYQTARNIVLMQRLEKYMNLIILSETESAAKAYLKLWVDLLELYLQDQKLIYKLKDCSLYFILLSRKYSIYWQIISEC